MKVSSLGTNVTVAAARRWPPAKPARAVRLPNVCNHVRIQLDEIRPERIRMQLRQGTQERLPHPLRKRDSTLAQRSAAVVGDPAAARGNCSTPENRSTRCDWCSAHSRAPD